MGSRRRVNRHCRRPVRFLRWEFAERSCSCAFRATADAAFTTFAEDNENPCGLESPQGSEVSKGSEAFSSSADFRGSQPGSSCESVRWSEGSHSSYAAYGDGQHPRRVPRFRPLRFRRPPWSQVESRFRRRPRLRPVFWFGFRCRFLCRLRRRIRHVRWAHRLRRLSLRGPARRDSGILQFNVNMSYDRSRLRNWLQRLASSRKRRPIANCRPTGLRKRRPITTAV